jgi:hypothetical protein
MVEVFQLILGALASLIASRLEVENLILRHTPASFR